VEAGRLRRGLDDHAHPSNERRCLLLCDDVRRRVLAEHAVLADVTVGEYSKQWLMSHTNLRRATVGSCEPIIRLCLIPDLGSMRLD
jgi:hypothetical protein